jgi:HJR/Mrr/RecB family endonuclease
MAIFGLFSSFKKFFSDEKDVPTNQHATYKSSVRQETLGQRQARHRQDALLFVKQNHQEIKRQKHKEDAWYRSFAKKKGQELSQLTGIEFEQFLAGLFRQLGYGVEMTASTGDYGADLILSKAGEKIAVQAKCYSGSVGVSAVQEVLAGMVYYNCQSAWVITTGNLTANAIELASKSNVKLLDSIEIGKLIKQVSN